MSIEGALAGDWCNLEKVLGMLRKFCYNDLPVSGGSECQPGVDRHLAAPTRKCAATPWNRKKCGLRVCDLDIWAGAGSAVRDLGQIHQDSSRSPINNAPSQHSSLSILGEKSLNRKQP